MATGGSDSDVARADDTENRRMCAICLETYRRPKLLPCFHTFCQSCLQGVAGSSPSLTCPSCRTFVILPPGGVRALQTNFYIEEDPTSPTSPPQRRLCEVCTEDREATHACFQCQQKLCLPCRQCHDGLKVIQGHTVVSLTQEEEEECENGGAPAQRWEDRSRVEMCPKHPDQRLLLRCNQCQADVCIQCKLTQHDGHPTEDLADTRAKARTSLQDLLGSVTQQRQQISHLVLTLNDRRAKLQPEQQETEQNLRGRADTLHQWVNQSLDEAVTTVQTTAKELGKALQDQVEQLQNKDEALRAQQDHVMRVLKDGAGADLVPLESQLTSCRSESTYLQQIEKELSKNIAPFSVKHSSSAVSSLRLREFVGVLQPVPPTPFPLPDSDPLCSGARSSSSVNTSVDRSESEPVREFLYSNNSESSVLGMCPISQNRLWVAYRPAKIAAVTLKLFDADGQVLITVNHVQAYDRLIAITDDTVLAWKYDSKSTEMITPDGKLTSHHLGVDIGTLVPSATNKRQYMAFRSSLHILRQVQFSKTDKLTYSEMDTVCTKVPEHCCRGHVSCKGEYVAFIHEGSVLVYLSAKQETALFASYTSSNTSVFCQPDITAIDVCFCQVDGKEHLVVTVRYHQYAHVVDHTDGCRFVRHLSTSPLSLDRPNKLATDFDQHVWIGCDGGKVAVVDL